MIACHKLLSLIIAANFFNLKLFEILRLLEEVDEALWALGLNKVLVDEIEVQNDRLVGVLDDLEVTIR